MEHCLIILSFFGIFIAGVHLAAADPCKSLKNWNVLDSSRTSQHSLIIGAGYGTTATRAVRDFFGNAGLRVAHWKSMINMNSTEQQRWRLTFHKLSKLKPSEYHNYDFTHLHEFVDVVMDTPIQPLLPFLYRQYPNSQVILTLRNATDWARHRHRDHATSPLPLAEFFAPAVALEKHNETNLFSPFEMHPHGQNLAITTLAYELHNTMVRCLVTESRLVEVDYFSGKMTQQQVKERLSLVAKRAQYVNANTSS